MELNNFIHFIIFLGTHKKSDPRKGANYAKSLIWTNINQMVGRKWNERCHHQLLRNIGISKVTAISKWKVIKI